MKAIVQFIKTGWDFVKIWRELCSTLIGLLLWVFSPMFLRKIDPTAATYDSGVLQVYLFAIIGLFILHGIIRILMKLIWPSVDQYLDQEFASDFQKIETWQKLKLASFIFFAFLFAAVLLARTL